MRSRTRLPFAVIPLALTYLAVAANMTIASVALPTISVDLDTTAAQLTWIVNATPIASAATILLAGSWADRFGRKRILQLGIGVFLISALLSALATSPEVLIALRAVTGLGSALAMPAALALTFDVVEEAQRRTAVGLMTATQAIGILLGPFIGGLVLLHWSWGAAFASIVPLLLIALILDHFFVHEPGSAREKIPVDVWGAVLMAITGVGVLAAVVTATSTGVQGSSIVLVIVAGLAFIGLWRWEKHTPHAIFTAEVLRRLTFWIPTLTVFFTQFVLGGVMFTNTQYIQNALGYPAFVAGIFLLPALVSWVASSSTAGVTSRRLGVRAIAAGSLVCAAAGMVVIATGDTRPHLLRLILGLVLIGCMGAAPALMTHMAVSNYSDARRTIGSAINSIAMRYGLAFGVAVFGAILTLTYTHQLTPAVANLTDADRAQALSSIGGAVAVSREVPTAQAETLTNAAVDAFVHGFHDALFAGAGILLGVAVAVWLGMKRVPRTLKAPMIGVDT